MIHVYTVVYRSLRSRAERIEP